MLEMRALNAKNESAIRGGGRTLPDEYRGWDIFPILIDLEFRLNGKSLFQHSSFGAPISALGPRCV